MVVHQRVQEGRNADKDDVEVTSPLRRVPVLDKVDDEIDHLRAHELDEARGELRQLRAGRLALRSNATRRPGGEQGGRLALVKSRGELIAALRRSRSEAAAVTALSTVTV